MSQSSAPARPRQVTTATAFVIGGSLMLLLLVFDSLTRLNSLETRDEIIKVLGSPTGKGLGLSVEQALIGMRVGLSIAAVASAAAVVLGIFVLQRHRGALIGLSIAAVPLLLTAPFSGGFLGALVPAATAALWTRAGRDWFAGRTPVEPERPRRAPSDTSGPQAPAAPPAPVWTSTTPDRPTPHLPAEAPSANYPAPTQGFGQAPAAGWSAPQPYAAQAVADRMPVQVRVACWLTWVGSAVALFSFGAVAVVLLTDATRIVDTVVAQPTWDEKLAPREMVVPALWTGLTIMIFWAIAAVVLAFLTWRRHDWARYLLAVSAGMALLLSFLAFPAGLVHGLACAVSLGALFSVPTRAWFRGDRQQALPPQGPAGPPAGPAPW